MNEEVKKIIIEWNLQKDYNRLSAEKKELLNALAEVWSADDAVYQVLLDDGENMWLTSLPLADFIEDHAPEIYEADPNQPLYHFIDWDSVAVDFASQHEIVKIDDNRKIIILR